MLCNYARANTNALIALPSNLLIPRTVSHTFFGFVWCDSWILPKSSFLVKMPRYCCCMPNHPRIISEWFAESPENWPRIISEWFAYHRESPQNQSWIFSQIVIYVRDRSPWNKYHFENRSKTDSLHWKPRMTSWVILGIATRLHLLQIASKFLHK